MTIGEVKRVKNFLEGFDFCEITESFAKLNNTYEVELLDIWQENGIVGFSDYQDKVLSLGNDVTNGFVMQSAELDMYKDQFVIKLKDGAIIVKAVI